MISAAIQDRDIANRGAGKDPVSDDEMLQILAKMVKQREESAKAFERGQPARILPRRSATRSRSSAPSMPRQLGEDEVQGGGCAR